jgi:Protein of unknown function (DUF2934)
MKGQPSNMRHNEIEKLAYQLWEERGRPLGSLEEDWFRAERELNHELGPSFSVPLYSSNAFPFSSFMMEPITE